MIYLDLFIGFLQVGMFAFGGAYGAIPLIRDIVLSYGWMSDIELSYIIAVSESTPGPIMVNLATYVGSTQGGLPGAVLATAAVVLPSFLIIILLTAVLKNLLKNQYIQAALSGLKPCITGIVLATGIRMIISSCTASSHPDMKSVSAAAALLLIFYGSRLFPKYRVSPIMLVLIAAAAGIAFF